MVFNQSNNQSIIVVDDLMKQIGVGIMVLAKQWKKY
jgi:hypothetical protein